ncbi:MAG TPA: hypothetical protein VFQ44_02010 [Streptosporangiaceae bacterium]|nr:hypothetical protein [Streptosporangiaceae bacterium]
MSGEPNASEVQRDLDRFRADVRDDLRDLRLEFRTDLAAHKGRVVYRDVYAANERRRDDEITALRKEIGEVSDDLDKEKQAADAREERRRANRKWVIAAIILPIGGIIAELWTAIRSMH